MASYLSSWICSVLPASLSSNDNESDGQPARQPTATLESRSELIISKLVVYPIKSCAGIDMETSPYSIEGLEFDRQWMLVDLNTKKMVTARTHPKAFLVQPSIDRPGNVLRIHIPSHGDFDVPLQAQGDAERLEDLQVWGSYDLQGWVVSPQGSGLQRALSDILETPVLLVQFDKSAPRLLDKQQFLSDLFTNMEDTLDYPLEDCTTYFADGYPFLLATEASFREVDSWLKAETSDTRMDVDELTKRYRPNIVVTGNTEGFVEDSWEELLLDDSDTLYPVSRCQRCPMPDVSPATGYMSPRRLPGTIVAKHRSNVDRLVKGACVGVNAIAKSRSGTLKAGMKVKVIRQAQLNKEDKLAGKWLRSEDRWS